MIRAVIKILLIFGILPSFAEEWQIECVDCPKYFHHMSDRSLCLDSLDHPHVAYGGDNLYYSWHDGSSWNHETVDDTPGVGASASLSIDSSGHRHICYLDNQIRAVKYAFHDGIDWAVETVEIADCDFGTAFRLSPNNIPHIIYVKNDKHLYLSIKTDSGWDSEIVDMNWYNETMGYGVSMTFDERGRIYLCYIKGSDLWFGRRDPNGWQLVQIATRSINPSIMLESEGRAFISFGRNTSNSYLPDYDLRCAYMGPGGPIIDIVDSEGSVGEFSSIVGDQYGLSHIIYSDDTNRVLKKAWKTASGWATEIIDDESYAGLYPSLLADSTGSFHMTYRVGYHTLRYRVLSDSVDDFEDICYGDCIGGYADISIDNSFNTHVFYTKCRHRGSGVKYGYCENSGWTIETLGSELQNPRLLDSTTDGFGIPHLCVYCSTNENIRLLYMTKENGNWICDTIDTAYKFDGFNFITIDTDSANNPHIVYTHSYYDEYESPFEVNYAYRDGTQWTIQTVDRYEELHSSFALDSSDRPHVVYYSIGLGLVYAIFDEDEWDFEVFTNGQFPVIALDRSDNPHIVFNGTQGLQYCWKDESVWNFESIQEQYFSSQPLHIEIDEFGSVHIAFLSVSDQMSWGKRTTNGWDIQTVDIGEDQLQTYSFALGSNSAPRFIYTNYVQYDLKMISPLSLTADDVPHNDPSEFTLSIAGPCPSSGIVRIRATFPIENPVQFQVWDIGGRCLRTISHPVSQNQSSIVWDGRDNRGLPVPNGSYICTLKSGDLAASDNVVILR